MKPLTADNVYTVFKKCLFKEGEPHTDPALVAGIVNRFGFHKGRLESNRAEILELLLQLPEQFHVDKGGGWTFLNACVTQTGEQWGEHINIEQLLALGIATNQARYLMPRDMWKVLPGGMPYFVVGNLPPIKQNMEIKWPPETSKVVASVGGPVEDAKTQSSP
jgi:hypothetical protein